MEGSVFLLVSHGLSAVGTLSTIVVGWLPLATNCCACAELQSSSGRSKMAEVRLNVNGLFGVTSMPLCSVRLPSRTQKELQRKEDEGLTKPLFLVMFDKASICLRNRLNLNVWLLMAILATLFLYCTFIFDWWFNFLLLFSSLVVSVFVCCVPCSFLTFFAKESVYVAIQVLATHRVWWSPRYYSTCDTSSVACKVSCSVLLWLLILFYTQKC